MFGGNIPEHFSGADTLKLTKTDFTYDDQVRDAVEFLNEVLKYNKKLNNPDILALFERSFTVSASIVCDYCDFDKTLSVTEYVNEIKYQYGEKIQFDYSQKKDLIQKSQISDGVYKVLIPYTKTTFDKFTKDKKIKRGSKVTHEMVAEILLDYNSNTKRVNRIFRLEIDKTYKTVGLNLNFRTVNETDGDNVIVNSSDAWDVGADFNYYFNPFGAFGNFGRMGLMFRTGLGLNYAQLNSSYKTESPVYQFSYTNDQISTVSTSSHGLADLSQTINSFRVGIPFGLSKNVLFKSGNRLDVSLLGKFNLELSKSFDYELGESEFLAFQFQTEDDAVLTELENIPTNIQEALGSFDNTQPSRSGTPDISTLSYLSYHLQVNYFFEKEQDMKYYVGIEMSFYDGNSIEQLEKINLPSFLQNNGQTEDNLTIDVPWSNRLLDGQPVYFGLRFGLFL